MDSSNIDWYRVPLDAETLKGFTRKSDLRGFLQAGSFLLIVACTTTAGLLLFKARLWAPMVAVCCLHSLFLNFVGMAAAVHELSHGTVFRSKPANELFYKLFCFLTWNNPVHFRASHMLHHQLTVYRGRDKEVIQGPVAEKLSWVNLLHALGRADADYFFWDPVFAKDDPRRAAMCRWARLVVVGHLVLLAVFIAFKLWVLIYLLVFGSFFASILANLCGAIQHSGLAESTPDWRLVCHTVKVHPLIGFLYWHMNFHAEHHMYAAVPFYNLPRFHREISGAMQIPQRSFLAAIGLLLEIKRKQKADPSCIHIPQFPPTAAPPKWGER